MQTLCAAERRLLAAVAEGIEDACRDPAARAPAAVAENTLLLIDDSRVFHRVVTDALNGAGWRVHCVTDPADAWPMLERHRPALVLLDIELGRSSGLEFLRTLRRPPELRGTPVIMLSSVSRRETILEAAQLGANDYLLKRHDLLDELPRRVTRHALR